MNLFKFFDSYLGQYMRKAARPSGGMESLNPRRWRGERLHHHGGGDCWLFVLLWMDLWCHELIVCKKWYKHNLKMRLTHYFLIHIGVHHTMWIQHWVVLQFVHPALQSHMIWIYLVTAESSSMAITQISFVLLKVILIMQIKIICWNGRGIWLIRECWVTREATTSKCVGG